MVQAMAIVLKLQLASESPGGLINMQSSGPHPVFQIPQAWSWAWDSAFLTGFPPLSCCWPGLQLRGRRTSLKGGCPHFWVLHYSSSDVQLFTVIWSYLFLFNNRVHNYILGNTKSSNMGTNKVLKHSPSCPVCRKFLGLDGQYLDALTWPGIREVCNQAPR